MSKLFRIIATWHRPRTLCFLSCYFMSQEVKCRYRQAVGQNYIVMSCCRPSQQSDFVFGSPRFLSERCRPQPSRQMLNLYFTLRRTVSIRVPFYSLLDFTTHHMKLNHFRNLTNSSLLDYSGRAT
jgi:hypothetical protein